MLTKENFFESVKEDIAKQIANLESFEKALAKIRRSEMEGLKKQEEIKHLIEIRNYLRSTIKAEKQFLKRIEKSS